MDVASQGHRKADCRQSKGGPSGANNNPRQGRMQSPGGYRQRSQSPGRPAFPRQRDSLNRKSSFAAELEREGLDDQELAMIFQRRQRQQYVPRGVVEDAVQGEARAEADVHSKPTSIHHQPKINTDEIRQGDPPSPRKFDRFGNRSFRGRSSSQGRRFQSPKKGYLLEGEDQYFDTRDYSSQHEDYEDYRSAFLLHNEL